ncbi:MAG TPA: DUF2330 domain-containing protein [Myxococcales bacterium]|nr:DUF2330 domain-containing protein [Myxococcales bacterium]
MAAHAFCGFFVSSAGAQLFNDATMVVLMRDGTRTVLSMQNNYRGPPQDFALVVPVPVVLTQKQVRTLPAAVFDRIDALASPRLVEEYEPGQCPPPPPMAAMPPSAAAPMGAGRDLGVKVEAKFDVDEYQVVILSAKDSTGLETWLQQNKYKIPSGAEPYLRPYVQGGSKFFVAKVNAQKVKFQNGQAVLSPLRFHYDTESFALPVRLGLMNSAGTQDLIVHLIGKSRYEIANRKTVTIPSNLYLRPSAEAQFGALYAELLRRTFERNQGAAVTEFAWEGALPPPRVMQPQGIYGVTCDPCPPPVPVDEPLARYLGADVLPRLQNNDNAIAAFAREATLTRLHMRYSKDSLNDDLVFQAASPIAGGIPEVWKTSPAEHNRFQGRYIIRRPFNVSMCYRYGGGGAAMPPPMMPMPTSGPAAASLPPSVQGGFAFGATPTLASAAPAAAPKPLAEPVEKLLASDVPELGIKAQGKLVQHR